MATQRTAVLFDEPPVIGHTYTLTDWIDQDQAVLDFLETWAAAERRGKK
jgi:hypothetical protein